MKIKFEPRDIWIGVYWKKYFSGHFNKSYYAMYICLIPMFPIVIMLGLKEHKGSGYYDYLKGEL